MKPCHSAHLTVLPGHNKTQVISPTISSRKQYRHLLVRFDFYSMRSAHYSFLPQTSPALYPINEAHVYTSPTSNSTVQWREAVGMPKWAVTALLACQTGALRPVPRRVAAPACTTSATVTLTLSMLATTPFPPRHDAASLSPQCARLDRDHDVFPSTPPSGSSAATWARGAVILHQEDSHHMRGTPMPTPEPCFVARL